MMIDISKYLLRQYSAQPCWDLVADFYATEFTGVVVDYSVENRSVRKMADDFRLAIHTGKHGFNQVDAPVNGCIVLLGKSEKIGIHHCGIYMDGNVLHATAEAVFFEPLSIIGDKFSLLQYWHKSMQIIINTKEKAVVTESVLPNGERVLSVGAA